MMFMAALLATAAVQPVVGPSRGDRAVTSLDAGWRVHIGDIQGAQQVATDDNDWRAVTLPYTVNGADGDDGGGYYRGPSWYRRRLALTSLPPGRHLFLQFDGVALAADVYVNGRLMTHHDGGFAGFRVEVTGALHVGNNLIAVRADNTRAKIAPLGGDFTVFGGLYRSAWLIEASPVHIDLLDHGGPGVYGRVVELSETVGKVDAIARVANEGDSPRKVELLTRILDAQGKQVASGQTRLTLPARAVREAKATLVVAHPRRWDGRRDPYLYRLVTAVREAYGSNTLDHTEVPLGFRTIRIDPERGFILNGQPYPLHGVNFFHSERPGVGTAVTNQQIDADLNTLDELGVTGLRLVHFQHPPRVYDDADRLGLPLWTEVPLNGVIDDSAIFTANIEEQMRELIRQNYNHPSVILWGIGNEIYATDPAVTRTLRAVHKVAREEDPSRETVYAHCCQADNDPKAGVSDVIGFNRYFGWYPAQKGSIGAWADQYHRQTPGRPFSVSEYGAGASIRQQQEPAPSINHPAGSWHPEQAQTAYHIQAWRELRDRAYLFGTFVWVGFDLASDGRHEGDRPGINDKGLVTYDRETRKDAFFWYQANWSSRPVLHVLDRRLTPRTDRQTDISVVTNAPQVELSMNGTGISTQPAIDHIARFVGVPLALGENNIRVRALHNGLPVEDHVSWTVTPVSSFGITAIPLPDAPQGGQPEAKAPPGQ